MSKDIINTINGCWIGSDLARRVGLHRSYFSEVNRRRNKTLNPEIIINVVSGLTLVRVPDKFNSILRDDEYTATKVENGDTGLFDHVLKITSDTSIGFWK